MREIHENIADYKSHLDEKLISIKLSNDTYNCDDVHCKSIQHCQDIDYLCRSIINCCLEASVLAIPFVRSGNGDIPGWTEQVKPELDKAKLWQEAGKPQSDAVYEVMKRTKHQYHYAVRRCKRNKLVIKKETLARKKKSRECWTELKKINPTSKVISSSIGSANGSTEITKLFYNKYRSLYSSVPTDDNELREIHDVINSGLPTSTRTTVTPDIIKQCIHKLKPGKDDGDLGFKSDHIINGSHRLHVLLSLLYNLILVHGYTPTDLLKSSVISIPKDAKVSLSNIDNYRGIALFNCICKLYDNIT